MRGHTSSPKQERGGAEQRRWTERKGPVLKKSRLMEFAEKEAPSGREKKGV